jgi:hypothetical protein
LIYQFSANSMLPYIIILMTYVSARQTLSASFQHFGKDSIPQMIINK